MFVLEIQNDTDTAIIIPIHVDYMMNDIDQVQTCTGMGTSTSIYLIGNTKSN